MTYKKIKYLLIALVGILFMIPQEASAIGNGKEKQKLAKTTGTSQVAVTRMDINNLNALESNVGFADYNLNSNLEGTEFPKGSGKNAVFEGGFLWGGFVPGDPQVRVGGSAYISGLQPGPIMSDGSPAPNPNTDPRWSIYRVRPDVYPGGPSVDLSSEVSSYAEGGQSLTAAQIRAQYESDWTNWPAAGTANNLGAPFTDVNGDGKYEPNIDIPGVPGADQTIYFVANDQDSSATKLLYGTNPMGMEIHVTYWAYAQQGALGNMYFKKWDIIHKGKIGGTTPIDSMFVSYWTDVDLGNANDDLVGCDTTLSLQFTYNGQAVDQVYAPLPPPADGFDFFQGPLVAGAPTDSGIFMGKVVHGKKNLPMTAAYFFINGDANFGDPPQGDVAGSTQFYNFFNGEYGLTGKEFSDPNGNLTRFAFPGDPVAGTGWLDGVTNPPADRRQGMASGPFTMAPGDTQEVVVAEMFGGAIPGVDRLSAINLVKFYDQTAQASYNNFFNIPVPPAAPKVNAIALSNKIVLDWGEDPVSVAKTENSNSLGYKFEGYNVYQLPYASAAVEQGKLLATYDLVDKVGKIYDEYFDPNQGTVLTHVSEFGNDNGIQRSFVDSTDFFSAGKTLVNGIPYYFAVTAYGYNAEGFPHAIENPISVITVTPHAPDPGISYQSQGAYSNVTHSGTADASVNVTVVDPTKTTGDQYQVSFHNEMYSLGSDGKWTDITPPSKRMSKIDSLNGSSITSVGSWTENPGHFELHYIANVVSSDFDWCDGIMIKLPASFVPDSIFEPISNNTGNPISYTYDKATNTIFFGDSSRSANGVFAGGEDIKILSHTSALPIIASYRMFDDGYGGHIVDVSSTDTLKTISKVITQHQWNVNDLTTGNIVLKNQTIYGGQDIYAPDVYYNSTGFHGPGGSSGSPIAAIGAGANVIFAGLQAAVNGNFTAPTTISKLFLNGKPLAINSSSAAFNITDFTAFGTADGTTKSSLLNYNGNVAIGATDINSLQQDYELKWTGVLGDTVISGDTVQITKSGGSFATLIGAHNYKLAVHPLNPNPGNNAPFMIRIPFEVWNITKNEQVNLLVYDRLGNYPSQNFQVWNTINRMYTWVVNTKYNKAVISPTSAVVADSSTWNWVFFASEFKTGDDIKIIYNNPLQIGKDTFTFTVPKQSYNSGTAKSDVNAINVFPNPYYGVNSQELNKYARFVTFSHLPASGSVTIHIFNLAGVMVKTINHPAGSQFQTWDLTNDSGLPVASGLYIAYVDMPTLGTTKILKLAIIQEQQFPDHF